MGRKKDLDAEFLGCVFSASRLLTTLTAEDIITENQSEMCNKLSRPFAVHEDAKTGSVLLYQLVCNNNGDLLIDSKPSDVLTGAPIFILPRHKKSGRENVALNCSSLLAKRTGIEHPKNGPYDLASPPMVEKTGWFRPVGVSTELFETRSFDISEKNRLLHS